MVTSYRSFSRSQLQSLRICLMSCILNYYVGGFYQTSTKIRMKDTQDKIMPWLCMYIFALVGNRPERP